MKFLKVICFLFFWQAAEAANFNSYLKFTLAEQKRQSPFLSQKEYGSVAQWGAGIRYGYVGSQFEVPWIFTTAENGQQKAEVDNWKFQLLFYVDEFWQSEPQESTGTQGADLPETENLSMEKKQNSMLLETVFPQVSVGFSLIAPPVRSGSESELFNIFRAEFALSSEFYLISDHYLKLNASMVKPLSQVKRLSADSEAVEFRPGEYWVASQTLTSRYFKEFVPELRLTEVWFSPSRFRAGMFESTLTSEPTLTLGFLLSSNVASSAIQVGIGVFIPTKNQADDGKLELLTGSHSLIHFSRVYTGELIARF